MINLLNKTRTLARGASSITQGDVYRRVDYIESIRPVENFIELSVITFPFVLVLTQACDLEQHFGTSSTSNQDKLLISVLVAPMYNAQHVQDGSHLEHLGRKMATQDIYKSKGALGKVATNQLARYHFVDPLPNHGMPPVVIDFKHYFSVPIASLSEDSGSEYVCSIDVPWREEISRRFASYLSRIGLPIEEKTDDVATVNVDSTCLTEERA